MSFIVLDAFFIHYFLNYFLRQLFYLFFLILIERVKFCWYFYSNEGENGKQHLCMTAAQYFVVLSLVYFSISNALCRLWKKTHTHSSSLCTVRQQSLYICE